ncbi:undecaprenyl-diphosphate phosphatase [Roseospira marina]|uniref:Undecaprenyl-diphosphatase n=1 Tax=Roseospira marina TaxID=140057 RepID=A0A5M6IFH0_9PROT|nr:undecaprenyl-diphosphate phosphatase [Roseospira marina]KAA5607030.1 undecaprenyl-diphosphate phosphatase [Roseospira marina]MBB4312784.1 undecaprenyl-diphosphatase [Roseospira marina]MBB5086443.1 undecaprenyl-diphosphatase [Roseospira marina]
MVTLHLVVLALVQGITEFLPISSSGHLALVPMLTDWPDQGLKIDVAVHVGTLGAVLLYFWRDVWLMICGLAQLVTGRFGPGARLIAHLIVATIPVVIAGVLLKDIIETQFRTLEVIAWATLGFGLLLGLADHVGMTVRRIDHMRFGDALFLGLLQALALIPGTSRSGITMTGARLLGYERPDAAHFSMLMSIPTIIAAGVLIGIDLYRLNDWAVTEEALTAAGLALVSALIAIAALMTWLRYAGFLAFVVYRVLLGLFLLGIVYGVYAV